MNGNHEINGQILPGFMEGSGSYLITGWNRDQARPATIQGIPMIRKNFTT